MGAMRNRSICMTLACACMALALAAPVLAPAAPQPESAAGRTVAIGDIHGDISALKALLAQAGIVDASGRWVAQDTTLVQTGDTVDRGAHSRAVLDLLMDLEKQAAKKRSRLIPLMGNHEMMVMTGDLRYVTPAEYAEFADAKSEKRRLSAWKEYASWRRARDKALGKLETPLPEAPDTAWLEAHPLGYFEQRGAYAPSGKYGKWLRAHEAVAKVDGRLFLHGGISPKLTAASIEEINKRVREETKAFDDYVRYFVEQRLVLPFFTLQEMMAAVQEELQARNAALAEKSAQATAEGKTFTPSEEEKQQVAVLSQFLEIQTWWIINPEGPLWFRGYAMWSDEEGQPLVEQLLAKYGASSIVVGHSPVKGGRIKVRFGGKVFLIDTGMLSSYYEGGRGSALEIAGGTFTAVYMDQRVVVHPVEAPQPATAPASARPDSDRLDNGKPGGGAARALIPQTRVMASNPPPAPHAPRAWTGPDGKPLPFQNDAAAVEYMRTATVVSIKEVGAGVTNPKKVLLGKDGTRMNVIFRDVNEEKREAKMSDGTRVREFRDSYAFEVAAYELAQLMGIEAVPPAIERKVSDKLGSVQVWIENAFTESSRQKGKILPPDVLRWNRQKQTMTLFDSLIQNWDRHADNILIDPKWQLWMVDHTRAFRRELDMPILKQVIVLERGFWERLQNVDDQTIRERLKPILRAGELDAVLKRRRRIVAYLAELIATKGEDKVLFSR